MGLRGKMEAMARGEVSTSALEAYGTSNNDAYDLLERVSPEGPAQLAAWCAFVLQTHGDNLIASGSSPGFCSREALDDATQLYQLAGAWLNRARAAQARTDYVLDTVVPQPYLKQGPQGDGQVKALRKTLWTVQSRLGAHLNARSSEPVYARLAPTLPALQSALDTGAGLPGSKPSPELLATIGATLVAALDRAYQAGQLLAMTELIAARPEPPPEQVERDSATLTMFLPGDPGFDPWCLSDPLELMERKLGQSLGWATRKLDEFWASDPDPAKTLALQAQIASAIENGLAVRLPQATGKLGEVAKSCPWPGVLLAEHAFDLDGRRLNPGDQFVLSVGAEPDGFRRTIAVSAARQVVPTDRDLERAEDERWAKKHGY
jgi:hypothetical protein